VNRVLIFTTPISIKEIEFGGYQSIPASLMILNPSSYQIVQINDGVQSGIKEGFQEGYDMMDCQLVDDKGMTQGENTITKLVENDTPDNKILGTVFSMLMMIVIGWFSAPWLYKVMVMDKYISNPSLSFASFFIGLVICTLGAGLFVDGFFLKYHNTTEGFFGFMIMFLVVVSYTSIAFSRLDIKYNNRVDFKLEELGNGFYNMVGGMITILKNIEYLFGNITGTSMIIGIVWWVALLMIILLVVCFVGIKNDPDAKKKEKAQKGYIKHLNGLIMGIGSIYGFIAIIYCFHIMYEIPK
jgi:hypothetical protein